MRLDNKQEILGGGVAADCGPLLQTLDRSRHRPVGSFFGGMFAPSGAG